MGALGAAETVCIFVLSAVVTLVFYFILGALGTANLLPSTLSVTTSFLAVCLTFRRSPYYAAAYAANDVVLVILWVTASLSDASYVSVAVCFAVFLANDIYGFISWSRMKKRQEHGAQYRREKTGSVNFSPIPFSFVSFALSAQILYVHYNGKDHRLALRLLNTDISERSSFTFDFIWFHSVTPASSVSSSTLRAIARTSSISSSDSRTYNESARDDVGTRDDLAGIDIDRRDHDDKSVLREMAPVAEHDV